MVDPTRRTFEFEPRADGRFIQHDVTRLAVACVFSAEFFVTKSFLITEGVEDGETGIEA